MRKRFLLVLLAAQSISCSDPLLEENTDATPPEEPFVRGSLYAAAVKYPQGYDFRHNNMAPSAEICFFRDSSLLFSLPGTMGENGLNIDADMHRIRGNHLFSDCCSEDARTHIFRDGTELFAYEGKEMICDLQENGGDIFTLGISRSGNGWSFRKNGEKLCGRETGEPVGGLYFDKRRLCFSYVIPNPSSDGGGRSLYFVSEGCDSLMNLPHDVGEIRDVRRFNGEMNILGSKTGNAVWVCQGQCHYLDTDGSSGVEDCRFIVADDKLVAAVTFITGASKRTVFWEYGSWKRLIATETLSSSRICSICNNSPGLCFAESSGGGPELRRIYYQGKEWHSRGLLLLSPYALCCDSESFAVGVNDTETGLRPTVIRGQDTLRYDFNGYFIHLALP